MVQVAKRLLALVVVAAILGGCAGRSLVAPGSTDGSTTAPSGTIPGAGDASAGPETAPASIAASTGSPATSTEPIADASPSPSARPRTTPAPTLDWATIGYAVGVRDPVALGGKARVELDAPVGPTCTLSAKYPNATSAAVGSPTHPHAGAWVWSWTVPVSAGLGKATIAFACTYAGLSKPGSDSFQLVAALPTPTPKPTPTPTWSISGSVSSPVSAKNGTLTFTGHVNGTPPPGIAPIDLYCRLYVTYGTDQLIASDGSVQTRDFSLAGPIGYPNVGTYHWHVTCAPTLVTTSRTVSGTFEAN